MVAVAVKRPQLGPCLPSPCMSHPNLLASLLRAVTLLAFTAGPEPHGTYSSWLHFAQMANNNIPLSLPAISLSTSRHLLPCELWIQFHSKLSVPQDNGVMQRGPALLSPLSHQGQGFLGRFQGVSTEVQNMVEVPDATWDLKFHIEAVH